MKAIAAVDQNWAIGNNNQLLVHIPDDMNIPSRKAASQA